jgi:acyl carrier protein
MDGNERESVVSKGPSTEDVAAQLKKIIEAIYLENLTAESKSSHLDLTCDECLAFFNSRSLLEFIMSVENDLGIELEDDALANCAHYNFDSWVNYIHAKKSGLPQ